MKSGAQRKREGGRGREKERKRERLVSPASLKLNTTAIVSQKGRILSSHGEEEDKELDSANETPSMHVYTHSYHFFFNETKILM